ncbi:TetR/AcrR family transcriptional regulator [Antrihabitans cavernicola]|uniref:TetR/AcrR family transcriptional regulator n=1 Tax=Antrihabitans cavernicola TaxID=2495913 RepID=A0A5A7S9K0_9NOCA|nr:TetR/AcrR family transcriptional regulator [Spelaeibacter cavernicola]KAA0021225.1 TetR/AcrR family transcriptional regulator [Spelaeibacter cavernicola]
MGAISRKATMFAVARVSRAESKERTHRRVLDAAVSMFLEHGYNACSLEQIADAAGYSTGAVYSNFGGKPELASAAIEELYQRETLRVLGVLAEAGPSVQAWMVILRDWVQRTIGDRQWARFELELSVVMATRDELRPLLSQRYARMRAQLAASVRVAAEQGAFKTDADWDGTAVLLLGLILGISLQRVVDPLLPTDQLVHGLETLVGAPLPTTTSKHI